MISGPLPAKFHLHIGFEHERALQMKGSLAGLLSAYLFDLDAQSIDMILLMLRYNPQEAIFDPFLAK